MHYQKDRLRRDMPSNPRIYQDILEDVDDGMSPCIRVSGRRNAAYGAGDFGRCMVRAAVHNGQVAGCTASERDMRDRGPTDEWMRSTAAKSDPGGILYCFAATVRRQLARLMEMGMPGDGGGLEVAIDMHLIPRYDKSHGPELVGSKHKAGTNLFERYITVQCVMRHRRLVLGVLHMPAPGDAADFVRRIVGAARDAGAGIATAMLDREFFAADVMAVLDGEGIGYVIPCRNTDTVVAALNEYAAGRRGGVSESVITGTSRSVPYTMIITERRRSGKKRRDGNLPAHERYIGFATNRPGIDPDGYGRRRGIETGYRMIQNARARTHSKSPAVRLLCFVYSVAVFNAWVMANAVMSYITGIRSRDPAVTQQHPRQVLLECGVLPRRSCPTIRI